MRKQIWKAETIEREEKRNTENTEVRAQRTRRNKKTPAGSRRHKKAPGKATAATRNWREKSAGLKTRHYKARRPEKKNAPNRSGRSFLQGYRPSPKLRDETRGQLSPAPSEEHRRNLTEHVPSLSQMALHNR